MDWAAVVRLVSQPAPIVGCVLAMIAFFLWRDYKREMRLQDRVEMLEKDQKDILLPLVERCSAIVAQNTAVMIRLERVLDKIGYVEAKGARDVMEQLLEDATAHQQNAE